MIEVKGDLIEMALENKFDAIVHGCNCFCTMGGGIAYAIKNNFPEAYEKDKQTLRGSYNKLGTIGAVKCERSNGSKVIVVNAYTQFNPGPDFRLNAFKMCIDKIGHYFKGMHIGFPWIGAGIGGGDWNQIKPLIESLESKGCKITIVEFNK
jgi:O-acetyl-ADP-ribose deacetylase (regulator of RNase III)